SGMAGLSAAVNTLKENPDLKVLVLEKQAYTGGSTRVCGGGIWAVNAPINKVAGQDSTKEEYISFMEKRSAPTALNTGLMSNIYDISSEAFTNLYNWGLPISANSWSLGNPDSQLPCFDSTKNLNSNWETGNSGLADFMTTLAEKVGVEIRLTSKVVKIASEAGAVSAVEVEDLEKIYTVTAKKVILATGGFTRSPDLIKKYAPDYEKAFAFTGSGSQGDGITLTEELGATVIGNGMMGLSGINPSVGYYGPYGGAVWSAQCNVNANGEDFGMKGTFYGDTLKLILEQPNSCCYGIYDATSSVLDRLEAGSELGLISKYDSLDELASDQKIEAAGLKKQAEANKISQAPFFCIVRKPLFIGSIPGLAVSEQCEVLDKDGKAIKNLYGAGELVYANVFDGAYPASGSGVGTSCYTGAIASKAALASM
ncbi:MAG: FAD-dependent oxidoreductase, partial [Raoultibacter sp.]